MRAGLQKLGRWTAGRLQGSKGVQKYDKYMDKSPFARGLLTMGDLALAATGGAMLAGSGAGAGVKGLLMGSKSGGGGAGSVIDAVSKSGAGFSGMASQPVTSGGGSAISGLLKGTGKALGKAGTFAKENKDLLTMAGKGILATQPQPGEEAAMMNAETARQRLQFEMDEQKRQRELEDERRRRIAELLMPYAQQTFPQYFGGMNR